MKKIISLILLCMAVVSSPVLAEDEIDKQIPDFVYLFHLYYDNNQLFVDRDVQFKYDVIPEKFVPETLNAQFTFKGEVVNVRGDVSATFQFDPRQGDPNFLKGKVSVKAPFAPDGQKVNFYDGQGNQVLSVFVSDSSFCNDDGVCNAEVGEDAKTCPLDCKVEIPTPSASVQPSEGSGGAGLVWNLIYIIVGVGFGGGLWYFFKKRKSPSATETTTILPPPPSI